MRALGALLLLILRVVFLSVGNGHRGMNCMSADTFVDTNILIYAHDLDAGAKHQCAAGVIRKLWESGGGTISTQVLQEFYVNVTQKIPQPLPYSVAQRLIQHYFAWNVEINDAQSTLQASEIQERYQLSFWDALIIAAAYEAGTTKLLTEDLTHGQVIEGISIENPFL